MWLILQYIREAMDSARALGQEATAEQRIKFLALHGDSPSGPSRILSIAGNNAEIHIDGVLTDVPDFFAMFFGGGNTTYSEIIQALAEAETDPVVDNIILRVNSPGGLVSGLFEALQAIRNTTKPIKAIVGSIAASAAYAIVAEADSIIAENQMTQFGSIGVVAHFKVFDEDVMISSTEAPNKAPDVTTPEGAAIIRKELDAVHRVFVSAIAAARGTNEETINANFGRGALVLSADALSRNMIDSILDDTLGATDSETNTRNEPGTSEARTMDLNELRRDHSEIYAQAVQIGTDAERDRVTAHLKMGQGFGAMDIAAKAIADGSDMTATLNAEYMTAGRNKADLDDVAADDNATGAAADKAAQNEASAADLDQEAVVQSVEGALGIAPSTTA